MAPSIPTPPKISFIPKTSLVREEAFLERRRPRSLLVFFAIFSLVASLGSYAGLAFYEQQLSGQVADRVEKVEKARDILLGSKVINDARTFQAQAGLVQKILDEHIVVSPVFDFLSKVTIASVMYDSFVFKHENGMQVIELKGEAPSYASLAYQADVLKKYKEETKVIIDYTFSGVSLSRLQSVQFSLKITFAPGYLSYTAASRRLGSGQVSSSLASNESTSFGAQKGEVSSSTPIQGQVVVDTGAMIAPETAPMVIPESPEVAQGEGIVDTTTVQADTKTSFWSWFKFW